jgi:hypothetical protein
MILAAAAGAGTLVAGRRVPMPIRCALGLMVWGEALFLLAAAGWLNGMTASALFAISVAGGVWRGRIGVRISAWWLLAAPMFVMALHPPLAFDETLYHLPFVRALAESGQLRFLPGLRFPAFPQFQELLCVPVYLLAGDTATHLVSLAEVLLAIGIVAEWAGPLAAALLAGSPILLHLGTIGYVDPALMLFVTAGFYCIDDRSYLADRFGLPATLRAALSWRRDAVATALTHRDKAASKATGSPNLPAESRDRMLTILAAVFFGAACGVKYLGGYFAVAALVIVLVRRWRSAPLFAGVTFLAAVPTYLWLTLTTGNPLFPFAGRIFGTTSWAPRAETLEGVPWIRVLRVAWDVTFARERMNQQPPVTPLLIAMLLLVGAAAVRDWRARTVVLLSAVYVLVLVNVPQDTRYLIPLLPLFAVGAAVIVATQKPRWVAMLTVVAILPSLLYAGYRIRKDGLPPVTPAARELALTRRLPGYAALQRAGKARVYTCHEEQLQYYAQGQLVGDFFGPHAYADVLFNAPDTATLAARLRALKVDYLLVATSRSWLPKQKNGGFVLAYEDSHAQLWRVQPALPR